MVSKSGICRKQYQKYSLILYSHFFHRGLEEKIQILKNKPLLKDYSNTFIDIDETQRRLELEEPYSGKSREKCKTSKSGL